MGYYGAIHMDPVFTCTAITMRGDAMYQTLQHGSAFVLDQCDAPNISAMRMEAEALRVLRDAGIEAIAASLRHTGGGGNNFRVAIRQKRFGEARSAIAALFGKFVHSNTPSSSTRISTSMMISSRVGVWDAFPSRRGSRADDRYAGYDHDPSLKGRQSGAKAGFDCTQEFGKKGQIPFTRCAAKQFTGPPDSNRRTSA